MFQYQTHQTANGIHMYTVINQILIKGNIVSELEVVLTNNLYRIDCSCGIITMWQFFAWRTGTVVFYVLDGNTVKGTSSFHVNG